MLVYVTSQQYTSFTVGFSSRWTVGRSSDAKTQGWRPSLAGLSASVLDGGKEDWAKREREKDGCWIFVGNALRSAHGPHMSSRRVWHRTGTSMDSE